MSASSLSGVPAHEIVATVRHPFLVLDAQRRVLAASPAFFLHFGASADDWIGRPLLEAGGAEWVSSGLVELLNEAPAHDLLEDRPVALGGPDGETVAYRATVRPLRARANEIETLLLSLVPEAGEPPRRRRRTEQEELRRLAREGAAQPTLLLDADGRCRFATAPCEALLGYPVTDLLATPPVERFHREDAPAVQARLDAVLRSNRVEQFTARVRRGDGEYLWIETTARQLDHPTLGALVHAALRDVTQRKRTEEALRWLGRQTRLILDSAAEGIFGVDSRGTVTFVNPAAARLLGCTPADLMGRPQAEFTGGAAEEIAGTLRDGVARSSRAHEFEHSDGSALPVEYTSTPARQNGDVVGAVVTFRDLSERVRSEAALRRAERLAAVGQTVLTLRHEINNPLTALLAEAQLLELGGNSPDEEREMIASITSGARRIRDAVRRLTEAAGVEAEGAG